MTNDDQMYVRHLKQALEAAELEIKGLENEARERENLLTQMQEQLNPTNMGEPASCRKQIEELQSRIAMQDEALQKLARLGNGDLYGNSIGNCIAIDAISADVAAWQEKLDKEVAAKALEEAIQACRDEENKARALK